MAEYLHPGVHIEEIERGPRPIEGVPTSIGAFLGEAERGSFTPRLVTSYRDCQRWFGDVFSETKFLPHAVSGFFENGGTRTFICRIVGAGATTAEASFGDFILRAAGPGAWGSRVFARIVDSTTKKADGSSVGFRVQLAYWSGEAPPVDPFGEEGRRAAPSPALFEDFDDLVADEASPDFYGKRVPFIDLAKGNANQGPDSSALGVLVRTAGMPATARPANGAQLLIGGADDVAAPGVDDFKGGVAGGRTTDQGLLALERDPCRDVALVYAPNVSSAIAKAVVSHCENMRFHVQDELNPKGVNVLRNFPGRGIRVWGARTLTSNALWKYVSVRRLFIFLERSISEGTRWVVFEPNDERLWARVIDTIRLFLRSQWRLGALFGRTENEAFFITCDRTTMTQDDILNGRLICEIGIAPLRPAEFVILRIFQHTAEAQRQESAT